MLTLTDLSKSYGEHLAVDRLSLHVAAGEIAALLGPNGAGKTTVVSIVAGIRRSDRGEVRVGGVGGQGRSARRRRARLIGYAPQETGLYELLSVRQNMLTFAGIYGLGRRDAAARIGQLAEQLDLATLLDRPVSRLSGGERRRVHTAAALLHEPSLLLLDEPTVGADLASRQALLAEVKGLASRGTTVLYTTHYLAEVELLGARVVIIDRGRIVADGGPAELVAAHAPPAVVLRFAGPAPEVRGLRRVERDGSTIRLTGPRALANAQKILGALGPYVDQLVAMEQDTADLEAVFLALTGHQFAANEDLQGGVSPEGQPPGGTRS